MLRRCRVCVGVEGRVAIQGGQGGVRGSTEKKTLFEFQPNQGVLATFDCFGGRDTSLTIITELVIVGKRGDCV